MALEKNQLTYSTPISLYYGAKKSEQQLHWLDYDRKLVVKLVISKLQTVTEPTNYTKLSKKIIRQSRRFSKLKPV